MADGTLSGITHGTTRKFTLVGPHGVVFGRSIHCIVLIRAGATSAWPHAVRAPDKNRRVPRVRVDGGVGQVEGRLPRQIVPFVALVVMKTGKTL